MSNGLENLAPLAIGVWRRGGADTLATVRPFLAQPDPDSRIGICTTLRFLLGLTSVEMGRLLGTFRDRDLAAGAEIFVVDPPPTLGEFDLTGYAPRRAPPPPPPPPEPAEGEEGGEAAEPVRVVPPPALPPIYPPGFGAPLWLLAGVPQTRLRRIATLRQGQAFAYETRLLPARF